MGSSTLALVNATLIGYSKKERVKSAFYRYCDRTGVYNMSFPSIVFSSFGLVNYRAVT